MGHFSVKIIAPDGSNLNGNQQAEGLYLDFGKMTIAGSTADNNEAAGYNVSVSTNAKLGRVGLNYSF